MANLLEQLTREYDIVLIDTSPLLPVTDAAILSKLTAGALIVVGADKLHRQQLSDALGSLETVDARVLGVVLNRLPHKRADGYTYYYYDDYSSTPAGSNGSKKKKVRASKNGRAKPRPARAHTRRSTEERVEAAGTVESMFGEPLPTGAAGRSDEPRHEDKAAQD